MHIVIIAMGSAGDVHPFLGLAQAFTRRGHRVTFCTNPAFAGLVERCGLRLLPLGTAEEYHAAMSDPALWNPRSSFKVLWGLMAGFIRPLYDLLESEIDDDTVMVGSLWAFGARMLHEKHNVPYVSVQVSPSTLLSSKLPPVHKRFTIPSFLPLPMRAGLLWGIERGVLDRICGPALNRERLALDLQPLKHILSRWVHSPEQVIGLFPEWFAPPQSDWPPNVLLTGFPLFDEKDLREPDAELEDFLAGHDAPIVVTPGSTLVDGKQFFDTAAQVLKALDQPGIFLAKAGEPMPALPASILVRSYVPLSLLLPRARVLVHHGGIGTMSQALAAGVPQLAIPFAHDQFDNAARLERLGCGLRVDAPINKIQLFDAIARLLSEPHFQKNCTATQRFVASGEVSCLKALAAIEMVGGSAQRSVPHGPTLVNA